MNVVAAMVAHLLLVFTRSGEELRKVVWNVATHHGRPVRLCSDISASTVHPGKENHRCVKPMSGRSPTAAKALIASCECRSVSSGVSGFIRTRSPSVASERECIVGVEARSAVEAETSTAADVDVEAVSATGVAPIACSTAAASDPAAGPALEVDGKASEGIAATGVAPTACSTAAASAAGEGVGVGALCVQGIHERCRTDVAVATDGPMGRLPSAIAEGWIQLGKKLATSKHLP